MTHPADRRPSGNHLMCIQGHTGTEHVLQPLHPNALQSRGPESKAFRIQALRDHAHTNVTCYGIKSATL